MQNKILELFRLTRDARKQGVAMQHKLLLYWISMVLAIFGVLLVVLSVAGVFSGSGEKLHQALSAQQAHTVAELNEQFATLTAQGIVISNEASDTLNSILYTEPTSALSDDPAALEQIQRELYATLNTVLRSSPCNGVYLVLDATTNTAAKGSDTSRAGLYLRFANLNSKNAVDQDVVFYRGIPDIAREHQLELHNRWKMEFDTSLMVDYRDMIEQQVDKLSDSCVWTQRSQLTDSWENIVLLMVPIRGSGDAVRGICGVELGDLYLRLSYPAQESEFGSMVTVLAPMEDNTLLLSQGMTGGLEGVYLDDADTLQIQQGKQFHTYTGQNGAYLGVHTKLDMEIVGGGAMYAVTLVPEECYNAVTASEKRTWFIGSVLFLLAMLVVSVLLSRWFVRPIAKSLAAIQSDSLHDAGQTGIAEIDSLVALLRSKAQSSENHSSLPTDIAELFDGFARRAAGLTTAERSILRHYSEGREVAEVAEAAFISINTLRKHNANIYRKLEIGSRDELMLYIELFRRVGRLEEILQEPVATEQQTI